VTSSGETWQLWVVAHVLCPAVRLHVAGLYDINVDALQCRSTECWCFLVGICKGFEARWDLASGIPCVKCIDGSYAHVRPSHMGDVTVVDHSGLPLWHM
jgi:hypothetical protein